MALRGRSYQVLGGRTRPARRHEPAWPAKVGALAGLSLLLLVGLGVPSFGAMSASLINGLGSLAGNHGFTLSNYSRVLHDPDKISPLWFSARLAAVTATATALLGLVTARLLTQRGNRAGARVLDLVLLTAVALPGIVFAAGYIFTYNLPWVAHNGIHLYQTTTLLVLGHIATALPPTARVLVGAVGQVQDTMRAAGRVHGSGALGSWVRVVLPPLARPLVTAWVLTFSATLLELPVSQLLYPPGHPPVAIGIEKSLANYDFGGGTAIEVVAIGLALAVVAVVWGLYRLLAPRLAPRRHDPMSGPPFRSGGHHDRTRRTGRHRRARPPPPDHRGGQALRPGCRAARGRPGHCRGPVPRAARPVGVGQVDARPGARRRRAAVRRHDPLRRHPGRRRAPRAAARAA
jgi:iron(III) transport system permease protein